MGSLLERVSALPAYGRAQAGDKEKTLYLS